MKRTLNKPGVFYGNQWIGSLDLSKKKHKKVSFFQKVKSAFETIMLYSALTLAVVASVVLIAKGADNAQASSVVVDNLSNKVEDLKWEVVEAIKSCESAGHKEEDGIIIFDSNNKASIGSFQFQKNTVIHYYKKLYGKTITPKEAVLIALDDEKAGQLAYDVIFKSGSRIKDWYTCGNKKSVQDTLNAIKKLQ